MYTYFLNTSSQNRERQSFSMILNGGNISSLIVLIYDIVFLLFLLQRLGYVRLWDVCVVETSMTKLGIGRWVGLILVYHVFIG